MISHPPDQLRLHGKTRMQLRSQAGGIVIS